MNNRLHVEAKQLIQEDKSSQIDLTTFNVERFMSSIDPSIVKMVVLLTRSCRSSKKPISTLISELPHTKKLRCFYCMCVLLFCTNNQCSMPAHILLTDIVDSHGGTTELIQILNRLGAVASNDTHARYMEAIVEKGRSSGIATQLKKNFTIILWITLTFFKVTQQCTVEINIAAGMVQAYKQYNQNLWKFLFCHQHPVHLSTAIL